MGKVVLKPPPGFEPENSRIQGCDDSQYATEKPSLIFRVKGFNSSVSLPKL